LYGETPLDSITTVPGSDNLSALTVQEGVTTEPFQSSVTSYTSYYKGPSLNNVHNPDGLVTRVEFASFLQRSLGLSPGAEAEGQAFIDSAKIPSWVTGTVSAAVERGIRTEHSGRSYESGSGGSASPLAAHRTVNAVCYQL
jgi:hypothetical protein